MQKEDKIIQGFKNNNKAMGPQYLVVPPLAFLT